VNIYGNHEHRGEDAFIKAQFEIARLKAEVERLTKAGDAMADMVPSMVCRQVDAKGAWDIMEAWHFAKEGKQP